MTQVIYSGNASFTLIAAVRYARLEYGSFILGDRLQTQRYKSRCILLRSSSLKID